FRRLPRSSSHLHLELWESKAEREKVMRQLIAEGAHRVAAMGRALQPEAAALDPFEHLGAPGVNLLLGMSGPTPAEALVSPLAPQAGERCQLTWLRTAMDLAEL